MSRKLILGFTFPHYPKPPARASPPRSYRQLKARIIFPKFLISAAIFLDVTPSPFVKSIRRGDTPGLCEIGEVPGGAPVRALHRFRTPERRRGDTGSAAVARHESRFAETCTAGLSGRSYYQARSRHFRPDGIRESRARVGAVRVGSLPGSSSHCASVAGAIRECGPRTKIEWFAPKSRANVRTAVACRWATMKLRQPVGGLRPRRSGSPVSSLRSYATTFHLQIKDSPRHSDRSQCRLHRQHRHR